MKFKNFFSYFISAGIFLFLLAPFFIFIFKASDFENDLIDSIFFKADFSEISWALKNSFAQASLSSLFTFIFGLFYSSGLFFLKKKNISGYFWFEFMLFLPSLMPSLFSILILFSLIQPFPIGLFGVSIVHGFIFSGFFAIQWVRIIDRKAQRMIESAFILGANSFKIWKEILVALQRELFQLLFVVFSASFVSFAVPIAVGGGKSTTLEILIFEKMRLSSDWNQVFFISFFQVLILFAFSFFGILFFKKMDLFSEDKVSKNSGSKLLGNEFGFLILTSYILLMIGGLFHYSLKGFFAILKIPGLLLNIIQVLPASILASVAVGLLIVFILLLVSYSVGIYIEKKNKNFLEFFLNGITAPSTSLVGFSVIIILSKNFHFEWICYVFGFNILILASLYRMGFGQILNQLKPQTQVAKTLGSSNFLIFKRIIFPQILPVTFRMGGIAALWCVGDFAFTKIVFSEELTLAQLIGTLMVSFQIEAATALMFFMILLGAVLFFIFERGGNVLSKKIS